MKNKIVECDAHIAPQKHYLKKTLSLLLSLIMLFSITAGIDLSAYAETSGDYEFIQNDVGIIEITKYTGTASKLSIPSKISGYTVVSIGCEAFKGCSSLTSVTIPNSVTTIDAMAFSDCVNLKSITIPNSVTSIGGEAFYNTAYYNNKSNWNNNALYIGNYLIEVSQEVSGNYTVKSGTTVIAGYAFSMDYDLIGVTFPSTLKHIGKCAFYYCESLKNVTLPYGTISIGNYAFEQCTSLTSITIPNSLVTINPAAFRNCTALKSITLPDSVELISSFAFSGCTSLDSITILNKEARIIYNDTIPEYTTIKGYKGSTAEAYAQKYGNKFVALCEHTYKTTTTAKATTKKNGSKVTKCSVCGAKKSSSTIYAIKTVSLSKTSYVYNGKAQKPTVTVKDSKGKKIAASNYIVKYSSNKNVGKATVTITFKGNYSGTVKKTFTIKPKATTLSSVSAKSKGFTAKWKKLTTQTTGYQIQYSTNSKFSSAKTTTVSKNKTTSKTVSKLKAKKKYYIRVRTYKTVKVNGKSTKIYSSWSKSKSIKTK